MNQNAQIHTHIAEQEQLVRNNLDLAHDSLMGLRECFIEAESVSSVSAVNEILAKAGSMQLSIDRHLAAALAAGLKANMGRETLVVHDLQKFAGC